MVNLSIQPSQIEIQLKPGAGYVQSYIVKNNSEQSVTLNSSIDSWLPQGSNGNVTYLGYLPDITLSLSNSDLSLGQSFVLQAHQTKQLVLKIQIPDNFTPGDHYLTFFVNQDLSSIPSANSSQSIRVGSHLLISVSNTELPTTKFTVNNFKVDNYFIDSFFSSVNFYGEIENNSDYFDKISDTIIVSKNNNELKKLELFPDNVLAHHSRQFQCLENNLPIPCQLQKPLWPGIYQARIKNQTVSFFVFPYTLIIIFILGLITIKLPYFLKPPKSN